MVKRLKPSLCIDGYEEAGGCRGMSSKRKEKVSKKTVEKQLVVPIDIPRETYEKFVNEVSKGGDKYYTPYSLAQKYGIKISIAKKILRTAYQQGLIELYSPGRRSPIYVPRKQGAAVV
ncbi:MAG: 30S ribosomal protein S25e [Desulfurococcaceae archaeon]